MSLEDRLLIAQWLSPAFPVGGFAYSHGLETEMARGAIADAAGVQTWITDVLQFGAGRCDAILLVHARAAADPEPIADLAQALAVSAERHREMMEMGRAFETTRLGREADAQPFAVALGHAAKALSLPDVEVVAHYLQAFASMLVGTGLRFIPLGQSEGQAILCSLRPVILDVAEEASEAPLEALGTSVWASDFAAMAHETLQPRIFRT